MYGIFLVLSLLGYIEGSLQSMEHEPRDQECVFISVDVGRAISNGMANSKYTFASRCCKRGIWPMSDPRMVSR